MTILKIKLVGICRSWPLGFMKFSIVQKQAVEKPGTGWGEPKRQSSVRTSPNMAGEGRTASMVQSRRGLISNHLVRGEKL